MSVHRLSLVLLLALVAAAFANALGVTFLLDDIGDVTGNPSAAAATFFDRLPITNRPLTKASYAFNDLAHGAHAMGYAAVNLGLHLAAAALAFLLVRRAFARAASSSAAPLALAVCAIWAVHPALTESVTYISGRSMVFSAVLMLGALLAATADRPRPAIAFLCAILAPLARETALVLPLMLLWWRFTIGRPALQWPVWLGVLLAAAVVALMPHHRDLVAFSLDMRTPLLALRDNLHAATEILGFWFTPWRVTIFPEPPPPHAWIDPATLIRLLGFLAAAVVAIVLRHRAPVAAFGIGLALLALAPSNTIIWRTDPVALKPLYLAGLGLSLIAIDVLRRFARPRAVLAIAAALALALGMQTHLRNTLFRSDLALFADAAEKTPDNPDALIAYGGALVAAQRYDEAEATLDRALDLAPQDERAMNLLQLLATIRSVERRGGAP
ncbi:MAG: tetratricopeptide repeat protein [Micropepsaceae bacterium]